MNYSRYGILLVLFFTITRAFSQTTYQIKSTNAAELENLAEGQSSQTQFFITPTPNYPFRFQIIQGKQVGMELDSSGHFEWKPDFSLVDRLQKERLFQIIVEAKSDSGDVVTQTVDLGVKHINRPPAISELKPFYIKYNTNNTYKIESGLVNDPDNDPIVIIPSMEELPEGMELTSQGEFSWNPSFTQFKNLKEKPFFITFDVEDQPGKLKSAGRLKLVATQMDLPPAITTVPKTESIKTLENETLNFRFYLSDPNGDDDILTFDYLSNQKSLPSGLLIKNTPTQYEFTWMPGYDFVQDPLDSLQFYVDFFVLDKTQKREVKRIYITVKNTLNREELDAKNYQLYRGTLLRAWELMEQLKEKEKELKVAYNRAKKGKKQRSVVNASLGATTSLSSILIKPDLASAKNLQRTISTIGGTTVLTIGTLEATEVIGKSTKDLIDRLNYVIEKKNEIQTKGDIFARDYSLKSARRSEGFTRSIDDFMKAMQLKGLVALELDATWESKTKPTDKAIKQTFKDFAPE